MGDLMFGVTLHRVLSDGTELVIHYWPARAEFDLSLLRIGDYLQWEE